MANNKPPYAAKQHLTHSSRETMEKMGGGNG